MTTPLPRPVTNPGPQARAAQQLAAQRQLQMQQNGGQPPVPQQPVQTSVPQPQRPPEPQRSQAAPTSQQNAQSAPGTKQGTPFDQELALRTHLYNFGQWAGDWWGKNAAPAIEGGLNTLPYLGPRRTPQMGTEGQIVLATARPLTGGGTRLQPNWKGDAGHEMVKGAAVDLPRSAIETVTAAPAAITWFERETWKDPGASPGKLAHGFGLVGEGMVSAAGENPARFAGEMGAGVLLGGRVGRTFRPRARGGAGDVSSGGRGQTVSLTRGGESAGKMVPAARPPTPVHEPPTTLDLRSVRPDPRVFSEAGYHPSRIEMWSTKAVHQTRSVPSKIRSHFERPYPPEIQTIYAKEGDYLSFAERVYRHPSKPADTPPVSGLDLRFVKPDPRAFTEGGYSAGALEGIAAKAAYGIRSTASSMRVPRLKHRFERPKSPEIGIIYAKEGDYLSFAEEVYKRPAKSATTQPDVPVIDVTGAQVGSDVFLDTRPVLGQARSARSPPNAWKVGGDGQIQIQKQKTPATTLPDVPVIDVTNARVDPGVFLDIRPTRMKGRTPGRLEPQALSKVVSTPFAGAALAPKEGGRVGDVIPLTPLKSAESSAALMPSWRPDVAPALSPVVTSTPTVRQENKSGIGIIPIFTPGNAVLPMEELSPMSATEMAKIPLMDQPTTPLLLSLQSPSPLPRLRRRTKNPGKTREKRQRKRTPKGTAFFEFSPVPLGLVPPPDKKTPKKKKKKKRSKK